MIDLHLRAGNAGAMASACPFLRIEDEEGKKHWATSGEGFAADIIGALVIEPGAYDEEGNELTPPVVDDGFHVNLRCTEEVATRVPASVIVTPTSPRRVWL